MSFYSGGLAVGHLNYDDIPDLVVGHSNGGARIDISLTRPDGSLGPAQTILTPSNSDYVQAGDLDGNGLDDIVFSGDWRVNVLFNNGDGTFDGPFTYASQDDIRDLTLADYDDDNDFDVLACVTWGVQVFTNDGAGTLDTGVYYSGEEGHGRAALVCDFNLDGYKDIVLATDGLVLFANDGTDRFLRDTVLATVFWASHLASGKFNADDYMDLVVGGINRAALSVHLATGDGGFSDSVIYSFTGISSNVCTADLNQDGFDDIVCNAAATWIVMYCNGDGTFASPEYFPNNAGTVDIVVDDFDADGSLDVVNIVNTRRESMVLWYNDGFGQFGSLKNCEIVGDTYGLAAGDLDRDGDPDLLVGLYQGISVLQNDGNGSFVPSGGGPWPVSREPVAVELADLDLDGDLDVVAAGRDENRVAVQFNEGDGSFQPAALALDVGDGPCDLEVIDVDGDGLDDLVVVHNGVGEVVVLRNLGGGSFDSYGSYSCLYPLESVAGADINGDSHPDLVLAGHGAIPHCMQYTMINDGTGLFSPGDSIALPGTAVDVAVGRTAADGSTELFYGHWGYSVLRVTVDGDGKFQGTPQLGMDAYYMTEITTGHFQDTTGIELVAICARDSYFNYVSLARYDSIGSFVDASHFFVGLFCRGLAAADFDLDGDLDLSTVAPGAGADSLLLLWNTSEQDPTSVSIDWPSVTLPSGYALDQNYPNPFNPSTRIEFDLPSRSHVTLEVFNVTGQIVTTLVSGELPAGHYVYDWNGLNGAGERVASGVYFCRLGAGQLSLARKMALVK